MAQLIGPGRTPNTFPSHLEAIVLEVDVHCPPSRSLCCHCDVATVRPQDGRPVQPIQLLSAVQYIINLPFTSSACFYLFLAFPPVNLQ